MRKIIYLLGLIMAALMIASCVPVEKLYVCPDGSQVRDPAKCALPQGPKEPVVTEPETQPEPVPPPIIIDESAKALFDKTEKVSSLQFAYVKSPQTMPDKTYYMSRDKMKIVFDVGQRFSPSNRYDTVYLDLVRKTGTAYCEDRNTALCPDRDKAYDVDFNNYSIEVPLDWLLKLTWANTTGQSKSIERRTAIEVAFEINGVPGTMWLDQFFGVPMYITFNNTIYEYRDLDVNQVDSSELVHQSIP